MGDASLAWAALSASILCCMLSIKEEVIVFTLPAIRSSVPRIPVDLRANLVSLDISALGGLGLPACPFADSGLLVRRTIISVLCLCTPSLTFIANGFDIGPTMSELSPCDCGGGGGGGGTIIGGGGGSVTSAVLPLRDLRPDLLNDVDNRFGFPRCSLTGDVSAIWISSFVEDCFDEGGDDTTG